MTSARVPTTHVLECVRRVLDEHARHLADVADGYARSPSLLALTVDESERLRPLLDQALRADDGLLVDAARFADTVRLDGDPADIADLAAAVQIALTEINSLPDANEDLRLVIEAGTVSLSGSTEFAAASRAQQALRGLLVALFVVDLRGNDLVGLIYNEDALDAAHEAILWRLLMRLPDLLHRQPASTLVVVAGDAEVQFGLHCTGDPSLRWQINDRGLQARHPRERDLAAVVDLARIDRADAPLIMLMLGAGASAGYLPLGNDVRDRALGGLVSNQVDRHNYPDVAGELFRRLVQTTPERLLSGEREAGRDEFVRRLTLERVLREERHAERRVLSSTLLWFDEQHEAAIGRLVEERAVGHLDDDPLIRLIALRRRLVLVTVNFDQVIEAKGGNNLRAFINADDFAELPDYLEKYAAGDDLAVPLVKAHGDIKRPETIVADVTTTRGGLATPVLTALADLRVRLLDQRQSPLWYVGYSMRDLDLEDYWAHAGFAERARERWVSPMPDPSVRRFIEEKRLPRWTLEPDPPRLEENLVTLTASDFFTLLYEAAESHW